ncbi:MAG: hypothetical protein FDX30_03045 [Chlorobium sp.]|nr:MAG: hypothetical protein FDX30_03045 [Chlorobium sp.]
MFYTKFQYNQNWNIGFSNDTVESFIERKGLGKIQWMKHRYRDRFFADPFILNINKNEITVLCEELMFAEVKGRIVKLTIDKYSKQLLDRVLILELSTHLSYPAILIIDESIYIYPENSASGKLSLYRYNENSNEIEYIKILINEPLVDSTILNYNGKFWLVATKVPGTQEKAFLYISNSFYDNYRPFCSGPITQNKSISRPAGNFIIYKDIIYRPAQNCKKRYGSAIMIQQIDFIAEDLYVEKTAFSIYPKSFKYNLGMHTINFHANICVVDGCGYLYPIIGRIFNMISVLKRRILLLKNNEIISL